MLLPNFVFTFVLNKEMKKIIIIAFALTLLSISFYKTVQEPVEVIQYSPYIMDTPPEIDLSDTMVFYIKEK